MITIFVEPKNGLSLPKVGHVSHGEHTVDLTPKDIVGAEGVLRLVTKAITATK